MKPESSKFRQEQREELAGQHSQETQSREFSTAEELIRHDAQQAEPPPEIEERLRHSLAREPGTGGGWWRRLFTKS